MKRHFRTIITDIHSLPKKARDLLKRNFKDPNYTSSLGIVDQAFHYCMNNWFRQEKISDRKLIHIGQDGQKVLSMIEKAVQEIIDIMLKTKSHAEQIKIFEKHFGSGQAMLKNPTTICVEFNEPVMFKRVSQTDEIIKKGSYFTELILSGSRLILYNGINNSIAYNTDEGIGLVYYAFFLTDKIKEIVSLENDNVTKMTLTIETKVIKKSFKLGKITPLWNYCSLTPSFEVINRKDKTGFSRPIDFDTREAVILERKPHTRRLRNGELRLFTGVKGTYYKLKDVEKCGTIIKT